MMKLRSRPVLLRRKEAAAPARDEPGQAAGGGSGASVPSAIVSSRLFFS